MAGNESVLDRVRIYLSTLPPRLRARLLREIEESRAAGGDDRVGVVVADLLRDVTRAEAEAARARGVPPYLFCEPLEPFVVEEAGQTRHRGFVRRQSLNAVWRWLQRERDVADLLRRAELAATDALLAGDHDRAREIAATMRRDCAPVIEAALRGAGGDRRQLAHLAMHMEGPRNVEDLSDIAAIFRMEERLDRLGARLPDTIEDLDAGLAGTVIRGLRDEGADLVYFLVLVYRRLDSPAQILRLLTQYEGTDDGARLARSRFAPCAEIVLAEMDFAVERIAARIGRPDEFDGLLEAVRHFYTLANGISVGIDLDSAPDWRGRIAGPRRRASEILSGEVERVPGLVRRALRPRRREDGREATRGDRREDAPDPVSEDDIAVAEYAVRLLTALRPYRGELALNETLGRVVRQVEPYVEAVSAGIVRAMRETAGPDRAATERELDVAMRINTVMFGDSYARLMRRSADAALRAGDDIEDEDETGAEDAAAAPPPRPAAEIARPRTAAL